MKIRATLVPICIGLLSIVSFPVSAVYFFSDSFESGNMSATNTNGFRWEQNNNTSIVTQNPDEGPVVVYENYPRHVTYPLTMPDGSVRDWHAKNGTHSLRFKYRTGKHWVEQRFDLGKPLRELWIRYWLRVPINFTYGTGSRRNNKFFSIWMDNYEAKGDGSTVWLGMEPYKNTGATLGFTYSDGKYTGSEGYKQHTPFITTADRGRWMQIILHLKVESKDGAKDGIVQTYRRWAGESKFTKLHETLNAPLRVPDSGHDGFNRGYILGWVNAPYAQNTEWLLDDFTISDTSLLATSTPKTPTSVLAQ
ncbi:hypothetical protein MNBD_GAMMA24-2766 [hydrothermal vent metagenome]|uniref:Uncharacterized protein n=1 Tax=hydrothermal vent metagenome TaxID=652676 RepID=A0A3B1B3J1_9ZZZZ